MDLYVLKQRSKAVTKVGHKASPITLLYLSLYLSDVGNNTVTYAIIRSSMQLAT